MKQASVGEGPFVFSGRLIDGRGAHEWILEAMECAALPVDICSAYIRSEALAGILGKLPASVGGRILVRWRLSDLLAGASDFEAYDLASSHGLNFYLRLDFHGKLYCVPPTGVMIGSANATLSGLGLKTTSNEEVCTLVNGTADNAKFIDSLYSQAVRVDDALLYRLKLAFSEAKSTDAMLSEWPAALFPRAYSAACLRTLLVDECLWSGPAWYLENRLPVSAAEVHDRSLFGLGAREHGLSAPPAVLRDALMRTPVFQWLGSSVGDSDGEAYFGRLSASLHEALLDDPAPSRQGVKELLQNLLAWMEVLSMPGFLIDRPRHSQRVRLAHQRS